MRRPGSKAVLAALFLWGVATLFSGCHASEDAPPPAPTLRYDREIPASPPPPPEAAILLSGPVSGRGLPFLPPNIISFSYALYETEEGRLEVYFTRDPVFGMDGWEAVECGGFSLRRNVEKEVFSYADAGGWSVFIASGQFVDDPCNLFEGLVERLTFFVASIEGNESPLPAVFLTQP